MDAVQIRDPMGGANQSGMRDHNERLVLSLIQRHGELPSAEIARRANLSAQTVSIIIRELERDGLLLRGEPIRGKVGKPSVPMALDPDGALSIGLNVGRKSADLVLIDFAGAVRAHIKRVYPYPTPKVLRDFLADGFGAITANLTGPQRARLAGIGVAEPFELWNWLDAVNAPKEEMLEWRDLDLQAMVEEVTKLPVVVRNDTTAACTAEHVFGRGREFADYAYFFIGSFVGGGVVLNDAVYTGRTGNAGAFGSLPVATGQPGATQLIHNASIYLLERRLDEAGYDAGSIWRPDCAWDSFGSVLTDWIAHTAHHLAVAIVAVSSVIDFERTLVDVNAPAAVRDDIIAQTQDAILAIDTQGISTPLVTPALVGRNARAIGAATLPIIEKYLLGQQRFA